MKSKRLKIISQLMCPMLIAGMLLSISSPALAAGRQEALYPDEIVILGAYEQDGVKSNGPEDIAWRVLEARGDNVLLISEKILDARRYNNNRAEVTWEECTLREWLNEDFYETVFSDEEQEAILTTEIDNSRGQGNSTWNRNGGEDTEDKVFLLSYSEVREYFNKDKERRCEPTEYAVTRGIWKDKNGTSHWWLRSPGSSQYYTAYCSCLGNISSTWDNNDAIGVRPVIRVDLNSVTELLPRATNTEETANVNIEAVNDPDFRIENGILVEYLGSGGDVTIPDGVTAIGHLAFQDCENLKTVKLPNSVTVIGYGAFFNCTGLKSVTISDSVITIGQYAFGSCGSLTSVKIPDSVTYIGREAFSSCSSLEQLTIPGKIKSIEYGLFYDCSSLKSVTIPDGVTDIGANAFGYCSSLTSVAIPESVKNIEYGAFSGTEWFTRQEAHNDFVIINGVLVEYLGTKGDVAIPKGVTSIGPYAFAYCDLSSVVIPDGVTEIRAGAFAGCSSLAGVTIPESVTVIGDSAFEDCECLTKVTIPKSVTTIGDRAFSGTPWQEEQKVQTQDGFVICDRILLAYRGEESKVVIPEGIATIEAGAFSECSLTDVTIPESVTVIGESAFLECNLVEVTIPGRVKEIGAAVFLGCWNLKNVTIGEGVTGIPADAFNSCDSLKGVVLPDSVTYIGMNAFAGCSSLTSVAIPESVKMMEYGVFNYCDSLKDVYYGGSRESWEALRGNTGIITTTHFAL